VRFADKAAIITGGGSGIGKAMALEFAPYNIRVNCINPVTTDTSMTEMLPEDIRQEVINSIPLGHLAKPQDIAYAALYLASDESAMVTGTNLNVDGGHGI